MKLNKAFIAMVHVPALPGTPKHKLTVNEIVAHCVKEAKLFAEAGFDAILIENMHDVPYSKGTVGPEVVAAMTTVAAAIKNEVSIPVGIQILAGANKEALAVALATNLSFIRAEGFVFGHVADEGYHDSCAAELMRYRKQIGADHISVFSDIKKKHSSHQITADVDLLETAEAACFFISDGVIVTGSATGKSVNASDLDLLHNKLNIPVLVGSGITSENISGLWPLADAFIVGSSIKKEGYWANELDTNRISTLMQTVNKLKTQTN